MMTKYHKAKVKTRFLIVNSAPALYLPYRYVMYTLNPNIRKTELVSSIKSHTNIYDDVALGYLSFKSRMLIIL